MSISHVTTIVVEKRGHEFGLGLVGTSLILGWARKCIHAVSIFVVLAIERFCSLRVWTDIQTGASRRE